VSEKVLYSHELKVGLELTQEKIDSIIKDEGYEKIYFKILNFLSYRVRSEHEVVTRMRDYFYKGGIEKDLGQVFEEKILKTLRDLDLINDEKFVEQYIENANLLKSPPGRQKIREFLMKKGVSRDIIDDGLGKYTLETERLGAEKALNKKLRSMKDTLDYKAKQKIYQFLLRKGYSSDVVSAVVDSKFEV
jgi:regulatory protein